MDWSVRSHLGLQPEDDAGLDGLLHPGWSPVASELRRQLRRYPGGGAVCVYCRGRCVLDLWGGVKDDAGGAWQRETMSPSFSTTKGVASTLLHILRDRGLGQQLGPLHSSEGECSR